MAGYRLYQSANGGDYVVVATVVETQIAVDIEVGTFRWYVTAYNEYTESGPSNVVEGARVR